MPKPAKKTTSRRKAKKSGHHVRLRPANPFDLIRLIAHSQSDPRKAMAELVQNSLDADAERVTITRHRQRGDVVISVVDDGRGVFPDAERPDALRRIATDRRIGPWLLADELCRRGEHDVAAAVAKAQETTAAMAEAVASGNRGAIMSSFSAVGKSCKGCHESFRAEEDDDSD